MGGSGVRRPVGLLIAARAALAGSVLFGTFGLALRLLPGHGSAAILTVGVVAGVQGLLGVVGGQLADRLPRTLVMVLGGAVATAAWAVALGWSQPAQFPVAAVLAGVAGGLFSPAATGLMQELVPPGRLRRLNAILMLVTLATGLVAGLVEGVAGGLAGWPGPLALAVAAAATATLLVVRLHYGHRRRPASSTTDRPAGRERPALRRWPWVWVLVVQFGIVAVLPEVPGFAGDLPAGVGGVTGAGELGLLVGFAGAVVGAAVCVWAPVRYPARVAAGVAFGFVPALVLAGTGAPGWGLALGLGLAAGCGSVFDVLWDTALQVHVPETVISRVAGYRLFGTRLVALLVVAAAASRTALLVLAAVAVLVTVATLLVPSVRRLPATRPPEPQPAEGG